MSVFNSHLNKFIMKKSASYILLLLVVCCTYSCTTKDLETLPLTELSSQTFWKSEQDASMGLTACYSGLSQDDDPNHFWYVTFMDAATDNAYSRDTWMGAQVIGNGTSTAANPGRNYYKYTRIRRCNLFIENIDKVTMDETRKKKWKAEARFLRAFNYFVMVQLYGGVPLVDKTLGGEEKLPRSTEEQCVAWIIKELGEAATDLPVQNYIQSGGHVTKGAALALKARVELFYRKWDDAITDAKAVMDMDGTFELYADYRGLFLVGNKLNQKEWLYAQQYAPTAASGTSLYPVLVPYGDLTDGWASINPADNLAQAYEVIDGTTINEGSPLYNPNNPYKNRDPRLNATLIAPGEFWKDRYFDPWKKFYTEGSRKGQQNLDYWADWRGARTGYLLKKFVEPITSDQNNKAGQDMPLIRFAEAFLIYAEAKIEKGEPDASMYNAIDKVRMRAGMPKVDRLKYSTQGKLRELVRRERRVEFAMEGLRYYDIKRWDIGAQVIPGPLLTAKESNVNGETGQLTFAADAKTYTIETRTFHADRKYLWPIPQGELDANKGSITQNPGY